MEIAMVGLGRMGGNIARRLARAGHRVIGFNRTRSVTDTLVKEDGIIPAYTLEEIAPKMTAPRTVWVMMPAGETTEATIDTLTTLLSPGDTIIDGGNSNYKDAIRRAAVLEAKGFSFIDVGTSGGVWGLTEGYSLMIGGEKEPVERLRPIFETLAPAKDHGWGHVGPHGAGHFTKMVHNGIEYGMMQSLAEGFDILHAKKDFNLDLHQVAEIWREGSVVRSWLLDLTANALKQDQDLKDIKGWVADSGEGRWTVFEAIDLDVPAPVITISLQTRFMSRDEEKYPAKLLAAMRNQFGGHEIKHEGA
jgi:6-phosphogluconate dehydrogenase